MKLLTMELKQFKANSSFIKPNTIIPILSYLKIETGKITKNALHSFCTQEISYKGEPFLIEEQVLMNAVEAGGDEIEVSIKGNTVTLSSGTMKWKSAVMSVIDFNTPPDLDGESVMIKSDILDEISIAAALTDEDNGNPACTVVIISDSLIAGTNGFIGYGKKIKTGLGNILIPKATCAAIKGLDSLQFNDGEKYQFFSIPWLRYGFIKPDAKWIDISSFYSVPELNTFRINKHDIISFCTQAIKTKVSKGAITKMVISENEITLSMSDAGFEREVSDMVAIEGGKQDVFRFNPEFMIRLLKALPADNLTIHQGNGNCYYLTIDENTISLILKIHE